MYICKRYFVLKFRTKSAVLCTHFETNFFVAGCYDKKLYHLDPRTCEAIDIKKYHGKPILTVAVDDKYVITGSEDKTVQIYDRRAGEVFKTLEVCVTKHISMNE